ncbi:MAG: ThuA domain-containing protein [Opitutaceae bacterium]
MKIPGRFVFAGAVCALALILATSAHAAGAAKKKILFFSKSSGYEHSAIKRNAANPSSAEQVLKELGEKNDFDFVFSKDGSLFTAEYLAQFDAFMFYTTGDLTLARNNERYGDNNPPMTPEGKAVFLKAIEAGKGFVGVHSASDTFHSPGNKDDNVPARYIHDGDKADPYIRMLGGEFIKHDAQQKGRQIVVDAKFPGMSALPADFGPNEEWYSLKNIATDMHVLLVQDTSTMNGRSYERAPFPSTWARMQGRGRVFYTSMGHREDIWTNPAFQAVLMGGLNWAVGRVNADVSPNLAAVAPKANELPAFPVPIAPTPKQDAAPKAGAK